MFGIGWYNVKWFDKNDNVVKSEDKFLTAPLYNRAVMEMQTAYLQGVNVAKLIATPIEKK